MNFDVPILFIVFNRPNATEKVFQRLKEVRPRKLFVAADGPRVDREGEKEKCDIVRKIILGGIDWDCDLHLKFSDQNLGCGRAESEAMLWFFEATGEGIVLEDDTLPDPSFFNYCRELLSYYRHQDDIKMIGGNNFQNGIMRSDGSYYFSNFIHSWGYASWWRAWKDYDFRLRNISDSTFERLLAEKLHSGKERTYWHKIYRNFRDGEYDTWDFQFLFTMWLNNGCCIIPNKNLVTNIGFGDSATHTKNANDPAANQPVYPIDKIIHPSEKKISDKADRFLFKNYLREEGKWEGRFKRVLKVLNIN